MHRRERLATGCSPAWRLGYSAACGLVLAGAVSVGGVRAARAQAGPANEVQPADGRPARPVTAVVRGEDLESATFEIQTRLAQVLSRVAELKGQVAKASEEDKAIDEQVYRAQLAQAEAERALVERRLEQLRRADAPADDSADERLAHESRATEEALRAQGEALRDAARKHEELSRRSAGFAGAADASGAQLDDLKRQVAQMTRRVEEQQQRAELAQRDVARRIADLRQREAQLSRTEGADQAPRKGNRDAAEALADSDVTGEDVDPRAPRATDRLDVNRRHPTARPNVGRFGPADLAPAGASDAAASVGKLSAGSLDLVALATSYADAVGNLRVAMVRARAAAGQGSDEDQAVHATAVEAAERKARLLRSIAEIATGGAEAEYGQARQLAQQGLVPQSKMAEAESKVKILRVILQSDAGEGRVRWPGGSPDAAGLQPK